MNRKITKKTVFALLSATLLVFALPFTAGANMAAADNADIGSAVTFEKNDSISVLSEVLDITVEGSYATFVATYRMKNTLAETVTTPSMFVAPGMENGGVKVSVNGKQVDFTRKTYALRYSTEVVTDDWRYAVLNPVRVDTESGEAVSYDESVGEGERTVDTVTFEMTFAPNEEYDVSVEYTYRMGGRPNYDFDVKNGKIEYFLAPAAMWKDFSGLTVNLRLDKELPVIKKSSVAFTEVGDLTYVYRSDTLPPDNLSIELGLNPWQHFTSTLRNPYLLMMLYIILPYVVGIIVLIAVVVVVVKVVRNKKKKA